MKGTAVLLGRKPFARPVVLLLFLPFLFLCRALPALELKIHFLLALMFFLALAEKLGDVGIVDVELVVFQIRLGQERGGEVIGRRYRHGASGFAPYLTKFQHRFWSPETSLPTGES